MSDNESAGKSLDLFEAVQPVVARSGEDYLQWQDAADLPSAFFFPVLDDDKHLADDYWNTNHAANPWWQWGNREDWAQTERKSWDLDRTPPRSTHPPRPLVYRESLRALNLLLTRTREIQSVESPADFVDEWAKLREPWVDLERFELDAEYVLHRLERVTSRRNAEIWLRSNNVALGGRPMDLVAQGATVDVLSAIDRLESSSY